MLDFKPRSISAFSTGEVVTNGANQVGAMPAEKLEPKPPTG